MLQAAELPCQVTLSLLWVCQLLPWLLWFAGTDAPLRAQSMVGNALAGLKLAYAQEVSDDRSVPETAHAPAYGKLPVQFSSQRHSKCWQLTQRSHQRHQPSLTSALATAAAAAAAAVAAGHSGNVNAEPVTICICCRFVAISYDVKQKKPELSIAWAGDSISEKVGQGWCSYSRCRWQQHTSPVAAAAAAAL
jgi:hypothetical protein